MAIYVAQDGTVTEGMFAPDSLAPTLILLGVLALFIASIIAICIICKKAGYKKRVGLLSLIPGVNIILFFYFASTKWPIQKKVEELNKDLKMSIHSSLYPKYELPKPESQQKPKNMEILASQERLHVLDASLDVPSEHR